MRFLWPAVSIVLAAVLTYFVINRPGDGATTGLPVMRFPVTMSVTSPLQLGAATLAIAPDGKNFVYLAGSQVNPVLYLRPMDKLEATVLTGTEGASDPFFSEDGQWVAYFAFGKIKKISIFGGGSQDVCEVPGYMRGGCWTPDNAILFGHLNRGIFRVPVSGGTPEEVTILDTAHGEISHRFPQALPGGKWVLFTVKFNNISTFDDAAIAAENIETHERRELVRGGSYGRFLASGHLMYARGTSIYAVPFDPEKVEVTGTPLPVVEGGMLNPYSGTANVEVSRTGIMIYTPLGPAGSSNVDIDWMDRAGKTTRIINESHYFDNPRLSPDGKKIALTMRAANDDIWVFDIERSALSRLTFGGGNSDMAIWSPDGEKVIYGSEGRQGVGLLRRSWNGSGTTENLGIVLSTTANTPPAVTPDGKQLIFSGGDGNIDMRTIGGDTATVALLHSGAFEDGPRLSPDGKVLAYMSDESGRNEVYAVPYPGLGGKWQISTGGTTSPPIWSRNGKELFFAAEEKLMKVDVSSAPSVHFSPPRKVCDLPPGHYGIYDITPDGKRLLVGISESSDVVATQINVVVGWFDELKQKFLSVKQ